VNRRALGTVLAGVLLSISATAPVAWAQDTEEPSGPRPAITREDDPRWAGSAFVAPFDTGVHSTDVEQVTVAGRFRFARDTTVRVTVVVEPAAPIGSSCTHDDPPELATQPQPTEGVRADYRFETSLELPCNGRYRIWATGRAYAGPDFPEPAATSPDLIADLTVAAPPPPVTGLRAARAGDAVRLHWEPVTAAPPDFLGYEISRGIDGDSEREVLTTLGPDASTWLDERPPENRDGLVYRVASLRTAPDGSALRAPEPAETLVAPEELADPGTGGGGDTPTGGPDGSGGEPGLASPGAVPSPVEGGDRTTPTLAPRSPLSSPVGGPPSPSAATGTRAVAAPFDDGFDDELPYAAGAPGGARPAVGGSANSVRYTDDATAGEAMLTPIATALVLAMWAVHLRRLARLGAA
jgi:hypothetical protein